MGPTAVQLGKRRVGLGGREGGNMVEVAGGYLATCWFMAAAGVL